MNQEIIEAGIPTTPSTAMASAAKTPKPASAKVMVLAVHLDQAGEIVITPIDVEHQDDNQTELSRSEVAKRLSARDEFTENNAAMVKALHSMFQVFDGRLYRDKFRTFENFCFAIFGTHRIEDMIAAKARVKKLKAALEEAQI